MKKIGIVGIAILFLIAFTFNAASAKPVEKIGVVNMQKILNDFKEAETVNDALQKEKDALQDKLDSEQEKLKKKKDSIEQKVAKLTDAEKKRAAEGLNTDLVKLQDVFQQYSSQLREKQAKAYKELEDKILEAINAVAAEQAIDFVVEKGVVFVGGDDITEMVLDKLNAGAAKTPKKAKGK
jgi:outer membrane protein